jgi:hypothetical protein
MREVQSRLQPKLVVAAPAGYLSGNSCLLRVALMLLSRRVGGWESKHQVPRGRVAWPSGAGRTRPKQKVLWTIGFAINHSDLRPGASCGAVAGGEERELDSGRVDVSKAGGGCPQQPADVGTVRRGGGPHTSVRGRASRARCARILMCCNCDSMMTTKGLVVPMHVRYLYRWLAMPYGHGSHHGCRGACKHRPRSPGAAVATDRRVPLPLHGTAVVQ